MVGLGPISSTSPCWTNGGRRVCGRPWTWGMHSSVPMFLFRPVHKPSEVNYIPCLKNDDLPCRANSQSLLCMVNRHFRKRGNSSLQVVAKNQFGDPGNFPAPKVVDVFLTSRCQLEKNHKHRSQPKNSL